MHGWAAPSPGETKAVRERWSEAGRGGEGVERRGGAGRGGERREEARRGGERRGDGRRGAGADAGTSGQTARPSQNAGAREKGRGRSAVVVVGGNHLSSMTEPRRGSMACVRENRRASERGARERPGGPGSRLEAAVFRFPTGPKAADVSVNRAAKCVDDFNNDFNNLILMMILIKRGRKPPTFP